MAGLNTRAVLDGIVSNALQLGVFDKVNTHEPKMAPGHGHIAAIWADRIEPRGQFSGLSSTSVVSVFMFRIFQNMMKEPQDEIDPVLMETTDVLLTQYSQDFTLGGAVREIDLLGEAGTPLSAQAGYVNQDGKIYRIMDITIPVIINDAFAQEA